MKYPERHLIKSVDLYTQLLWHLPQLYDKSGSHQSKGEGRWGSLMGMGGVWDCLSSGRRFPGWFKVRVAGRPTRMQPFGEGGRVKFCCNIRWVMYYTIAKSTYQMDVYVFLTSHISRCIYHSSIMYPSLPAPLHPSSGVYALNRKSTLCVRVFIALFFFCHVHRILCRE